MPRLNLENGYRLEVIQVSERFRVCVISNEDKETYGEYRNSEDTARLLFDTVYEKYLMAIGLGFKFINGNFLLGNRIKFLSLAFTEMEDMYEFRRYLLQS